MAETKKNGIMKALIDGAITDVMVKTNAENVVSYYNGARDVMLSTHLNEIDQSITDMENKMDIGNTTVAAYVAEEISEWDDVVDSKIDHATSTFQQEVSRVEEYITALEGSDVGKSAREIAREELAAQLIPEEAQESMDTLAEIAAWIQAHPGDAAAMNQAITALQGKVNTGDKTVAAYVSDAISALQIGDYASAAQLTALASRVTTLEGQGKIYVSATQPAGLKAGDLWLQVL